MHVLHYFLVILRSESQKSEIYGLFIRRKHFAYKYFYAKLIRQFKWISRIVIFS